MKKLTALLLSLILLLSLTACGASTKYAADSAVRQEVMEEAPAMMAMGTAQNSTSENGSAGNSLPDNRKWIITVDMNVETDDLETMLSALNDRIAALDGYIEDQSIYNGSTYANRRYRNANLTIRIPADRVSEFSEEIGSLGNVVSNNLRREDVTLQYVDTEGRVKALQTEESRLLELLAGAETMSDLLEIEARLSDVRYELESYTSRLRTLDNQINYATVYVNIEEVQEYTPVEEPTFFQRIRDGFGDSLEGLVESLEDLLVFVIISAPFLAVYGAIGTVILLLVRKIRRQRKMKKQPKQDEQK